MSELHSIFEIYNNKRPHPKREKEEKGEAARVSGGTPHMPARARPPLLTTVGVAPTQATPGQVAQVGPDLAWVHACRALS